MARTEEQNQQLREASKELILNTAIALFAWKGFKATTTKDIARAAEVSEGLIYRHFSSKEELFETIITIATEGLNDLTNFINRATDPKETFRLVCQDMIDSLQDQHYINLSLMITHGLFSPDQLSYQKVLNADKAMIKAFDRLIKKGQKNGDFAPGNSLAKVYHFLSTVQGMTLIKAAFKEQYTPPTVSDMMAFLLKGDSDGSDN